MSRQPENRPGPSVEATRSSTDNPALRSAIPTDLPTSPVTTLPSPPAPPQRAPLTPGTLIEKRYRIVNLIGRGGMGEVYRAEDLTLGAPVALKFLPDWLARSRRRLELFHAEVRLARRVSHPNVCRVHDIGRADGRVFLSMELVEGEDLASLLRRIGRLPYEKAMEIARQLCTALAALHEQGLVHRDLKPANVLIDGAGRAKLADFGLAIAGDQSPEAEVAGTPAYMAPEQLRGRPATARSDIYSLGLVLYELFTGVRVREGGSAEEFRQQAESGTKPGPLSDFLERPERELDDAIARCLEPDPVERPSSAFAVLALLPGGDPLRAVLEAQQTPSPELVAASNPRARLTPLAASLLLAGALASLAIAGLLKYVHGIEHAANLEKSPEVLVDRARTLLRTLGYDEPPLDTFIAPAFRAPHAIAAAKTIAPDAPPRSRASDEAIRDVLSRRHPATFRVTYYQSPTYLRSAARFSIGDSPPAEEPRAVSITVSQSGDLLSLRAPAPRRLSAAKPAPEISDHDLLALAGLDPAAFQPGAPDWVLPGVASDQRSAWSGTYPGLPGFPIRAEIARMNGRVVSFEILRDVPAATAEPAARPGQGAVSLGQATYGAAFVLFTVGGLVLAYRQWRSGRGDLRGARRLAGAVLALTMLQWFLSTHHVTSVWEELKPFEVGLGSAAEYALLAFALYLAAEPIVRRRAPALMVSWTRVLSGRWRDAAVGRDILVGLCFAALYKTSELVFKTDWADPLRLGSGLDCGYSARIMASAPLAVGYAAWALVESIVDASLTLLGAVLIIRLCRWKPLGIAVTCALMAIAVRFLFGYGDRLEQHLAALGFAILAVTAALRFGLLALVVSYTASYILNMWPPTIDPSSWYFASAATSALPIAGLAFLGFRFATSPARTTTTRLYAAGAHR